MQGILWSVAGAASAVSEGPPAGDGSPWSRVAYEVPAPGGTLEEAIDLGQPAGLSVTLQITDAPPGTVPQGVEVVTDSPDLPPSWFISTRFVEGDGQDLFQGLLPPLGHFFFHPNPMDLKDRLDWVVPTPLPVDPLVLSSPNLKPPARF
jgi:hypothetical protein